MAVQGTMSKTTLPWRRWRRMAAVGLSVVAILSACGGSKRGGPGETAAGKSLPILTSPVPTVRGPKRSVAVGKIVASGKDKAGGRSWNVGVEVGALLRVALVETEQFAVVEAASPDAENPPQFLIFGAVMAFGNAPAKTAAKGRLRAAGSVVLALRMSDASTGRTVALETVGERVDNAGGSVDYAAMSLGGARFLKSPLGEACRRALTQAVQYVAIEADRRPWSGRVVQFERGTVTIGAGKNVGIASGDAFTVERVVRKVKDPATGELRSLRKTPLGVLRVRSVEEEGASGRFSPHDFQMPRPGDLARIIRR